MFKSPHAGSIALAVSIVFSASAALAETDEIVVTASPLGGDGVAVPVTQMDQRDVDRTGGASLGALLGGKPGITESGFATGASRPVIRGLDNFRVRMQENGVAAQGVSAISEDHGVPIDPLSANRVEVLRGPATLRYGTQAIGGVVTVLNDRIPGSHPEAPLQGAVFGALSSGNGGREAAAQLDGYSGPVAFHLDGLTRRTGSYAIPGDIAKQSNSFARSHGWSAGASYLGDWGHVGASLGQYDSTYGIPAGDMPIFIDMDQSRLNVAGAIGAFSFEGGASDYTHQEIDLASGAVGSVFNNKEWEGRSEYLHDQLGPFSTGALGVQASRRRITAGGEGGELLSPTDTVAMAAFIFEELPLADAITGQLALRYENVSVKGFGVQPPRLDGAALGNEIDTYGRAYNLGFDLLSASAGLAHDLASGHTASFSVQYAQRAPEAAELFSKGPHEATETFEIGNPALDTEKTIAAEASLSFEDADLSYTVTAFVNRFDGFIYKAFTGFVCGDGFETCGTEGALGVEDELTQILFSQRNALFYGLEAEGAIWLAAHGNWQFGLDGRFDLVRARLAGGQNVPRLPPMRVGGGLLAATENVQARLGVTHVFAQNRLAQFETRTDSYTDVSADISFDIGGALPVDTALRGLELGVAARNLTNEKKRNHVSFKKEDVLLPGRFVRVYLRSAF